MHVFAAPVSAFFAFARVNEVGETAKAVMPEEITDQGFLNRWKEEIIEVMVPRMEFRIGFLLLPQGPWWV